MASVVFDMTIPKIGDFILMTPTLKAAQDIHPGAAVVVPEPLRSLYEREGVLKNILSKAQPRPRCDLLIDLTYPMLEFTPIEGARILDKSLFSDPVHVTMTYHKALRAHIPELPERLTAAPFITLDADEERLAAFGLEPFSYYTVHTGSDFAPKNWGDAKFEELIMQVAAEFPRLLAVGVFGPQDEDLFKSRKAPANYRAIRTGMENVADILAGSLFHIDNDSGINHLAGALDTPSISIWGFTGPGTWGTLARQHFTFWGGPSCADHCGGSRAKSCENKVCLSSIKPADLIEAVRDFMGNYALPISAG